MPVTLIIGAQWGDEGKGRVADLLGADADVVARYAGGDNAGHTIAVGDEVFKLHLVPSGILHESASCVLGNGMVINPVNLLAEMDQLSSRGVDLSPGRFLISSRAHIITPAHVALDRASERALGDEAIGTTLRGIGPSYLDKIGRRGIRAGLMQDEETFADAVHDAIERANEALINAGESPLDARATALKWIDAAMRLAPYIRDTSQYINRRLRDGARVVCEGAQGTMLDLDHGDYPFVTSSSPIAGGALVGLGFGPLHVDRIVGVTKCFSTRVGSGPLLTELDGAPGQRLRGSGENFWDEFGTTTGRSRRCGWMDAVILRHAAQVSGFTELFLTKLDILSGIETLKIAGAWELDGVQHELPPANQQDLKRAKPVYESMPGWKADLSGMRHQDDLPQAARDYVRRIGELCDTAVRTVGVGPEREQQITLDDAL
ncbi:MAG: adenylosuccinate synthase [Anaerolineaceae bacterium]|nr:adenylosuccinate synthase [Anaerolineaceae bacterium]